MNSSKLMKFATAGFGLALFLGGCGSSSSNPPEGSGGTTQGSGGSSSGGTTGSGGHTSSGGTSGSGGETGSGGKVGSGGTTSSGGSTGSGGTTGSGGSMGSGGTTSSGGSSGGGATGSGGIVGVGGGKAGGSGTGSGGKAGGSGSGSGGTMGGSGGAGGGTAMCGGGMNNVPPTGGMTLTSPDQPECAKFDVKYTCACGTMNAGITCSGSVSQNGNNPELDWDNVPAGTKSFALTFLDTTQLDAGSPPMANHWAMWNIPAAARQLPRLSNGMLTGDLMGAKETSKFFEPCPSGTDKYEFALYALSTDTLNVSGAMPGVMDVRTALQGVTPLAVATLHGTTGKGGK